MDLFQRMGIFSSEETSSRREVLLEAYVNAVTKEAHCLRNMVNTGVLSAAAQDIGRYQDTKLGGQRESVYEELEIETDALTDEMDSVEEGDILEAAKRVRDHLIPQMVKVRDTADEAEELISKDLYPFPNYQDILFTHASESPY